MQRMLGRLLDCFGFWGAAVALGEGVMVALLVGSAGGTMMKEPGMSLTLRSIPAARQLALISSSGVVPWVKARFWRLSPYSMITCTQPGGARQLEVATKVVGVGASAVGEAVKVGCPSLGVSTG